MDHLITYTNYRLSRWYTTSKVGFGMIGKGFARVEGDKFIIEYIENGVEMLWSTYFHKSYLSTQKIDYFFNVWSEEG